MAYGIFLLALLFGAFSCGSPDPASHGLDAAGVYTYMPPDFTARALQVSASYSDGLTYTPPGAIFCIGTHLDTLNEAGELHLLYTCNGSSGEVISTNYEHFITLDRGTMNHLKTCIFSQTLASIPLSIDCSLGDCSQDAGFVDLEITEGNHTYGYAIDRNLGRGFPEKMTVIFGCLYAVGMLPGV